MKIKNFGNHQTIVPVLLLLCLLAFLISSCSTPKNITYFRDIPDSVKRRVVNESVYNSPSIQPDDILQVTVQTLDPSTTAGLIPANDYSIPGSPSNLPAANMPGTTSQLGNSSGYIVDKDGYVILPLIGKVLVKGKTTDIVRDEIRDKAIKFYKDPVVIVRLANFRITVLGEVNRPSTYIMPSERITILDALGMAGDLTIFGKRENVMLIRYTGSEREIVRFDLNNSSTFSSPYFYLRQGDVIYVEPNKSKVTSTDMAQVRRISILASVLSVLIVLATRVKF